MRNILLFLGFLVLSVLVPVGLTQTQAGEPTAQLAEGATPKP